MSIIEKERWYCYYKINSIFFKKLKSIHKVGNEKISIKDMDYETRPPETNLNIKGVNVLEDVFVSCILQFFFIYRHAC